MNKKDSIVEIKGLISIIMPVKNAAPFLVECIESILSQTHDQWELLAINDHSIDGSHEILRRFEMRDERITVSINDGKGIISALRKAYGLSKGEFITRMDADDIMVNTKLKTLSNSLIKKGKGHLAIGQVQYISDTQVGEGYRSYELWLNTMTKNGTNFNEIYKECVVPSPCWMMHREDFEKCHAFLPNRYPEDYDLCFRMYEKSMKVIPCSSVLHYWRDYADRSSRNLPEYSDNSFLDLKLDYFLKLEINNDKTLVLWGAGKKGKRAAKFLVERGLEFRWICNNPEKIGKHIYGIEMEDPDQIESDKNYQVMILVANTEDQFEIRSHEILTNKSTEAYFFC